MINLFEVGQRVRIDGYSYTINGLTNGGMGVVVFATALADSDSSIYGERIAAKVFFSDQNLSQVKNELRIWQKLIHPRVANLKAVGHMNDWLCASMNWYREGAITSKGMQNKGTLVATKRMLEDVTTALSFAFDNGILHLDIKPANILSSGLSFYLADWGIAKLSAGKALLRDPLSGGTLPYMSAERFSSDPVDPAADIYSLGMTAYEMLTNSLPFKEATIDELVEVIINGKISERIAQNTSNIPKNWRIFINNCCEYRRKDRPKDYKKVLKMISNLEDGYV